MMDFQKGVRARLIGAEPVAALINDRVSWVERPQKGRLPAVTLQTISDPRPDHLKGHDGARPTRVQLDIWAESYELALVLARACINALSRPVTIEGKRFGHAQIEGQRDLRETVAGGGTLHRQSVDFIIWHVGD